MQPTLVELDDPGAELAQEEVFGPVCALLRAADADDAMKPVTAASAQDELTNPSLFRLRIFSASPQGAHHALAQP